MLTKFLSTIKPGCFCDDLDDHVKNDGHSLIRSAYEEFKTVTPWASTGFRCAKIFDNFNKQVTQDSDITSMRFIDVTKSVADFYLLDVIIFDLATEFPRRSLGVPFAPEIYQALVPHRKQEANSLRNLSIDAQLYKHLMVTGLAKVFKTYLHYAISGELRHHTASTRSFNVLSYDTMWWGWKKLMNHVGGEQAAVYAGMLFNDGRWAQNYGGKPWADIAKVLAWYERGFITDKERGPNHLPWWDHRSFRGEFSDYEFVDRVFALEHNGGCCLNKTSWASNPFEVKNILNSHHASRLVALHEKASPEVKSMFQKYWTLKTWETGLSVPFPKVGTCTACGMDEWIFNTKSKQFCYSCVSQYCTVHGCDLTLWSNSYGLCNTHFRQKFGGTNEF